MKPKQNIKNMFEHILWYIMNMICISMDKCKKDVTPVR